MTSQFDVRLATADDYAACEEILRALPEWFGIEAATAQYVADIQRMPTLVACDRGSVTGFLTLNPHNQSTVEIHVMAVYPEAHRQGVGQLLLEQAEEWSRERGFQLLEVKTLGPSTESVHYDRTRSFYEATGFLPLEERDDIWPGNSCLILVKCL